MQLVENHSMGDVYGSAVLRLSVPYTWRTQVCLACSIVSSEVVDVFEITLSDGDIHGLLMICGDSDGIESFRDGAAKMGEGRLECSVVTGGRRFSLLFGNDGTLSVFYFSSMLPEILDLLNTAEKGLSVS